MVKLLFLLTLWGIKPELQPQDTKNFHAKELQQLYIAFGAGPTLTFAPEFEKHGLTLFSHANISFCEATFFRGGIYYNHYSDNLSNYQNLQYKGTNSPPHELYSYYLSLGKRKQLN